MRSPITRRGSSSISPPAIRATRAVSGRFHLSRPCRRSRAQVVLDGSTQPGFTIKPIIVLSGTGAGASTAGVTVVASGSGSTVRGFVINGFGQDGIDLEGALNTTIEGNFIGTNAAGTAAIANGYDGVEIDTAARATRSAARRPPPATSSPPTLCRRGDRRRERQRRRGRLYRHRCDRDGRAGQQPRGRRIRRWCLARTIRASGNTIGGLTATPGTGAGNLISGNTYAGVSLDSAGPEQPGGRQPDRHRRHGVGRSRKRLRFRER